MSTYLFRKTIQLITGDRSGVLASSDVVSALKSLYSSGRKLTIKKKYKYNI